jgi:hypothetical protein
MHLQSKFVYWKKRGFMMGQCIVYVSERFSEGGDTTMCETVTFAKHF